VKQATLRKTNITFSFSNVDSKKEKEGWKKGRKEGRKEKRK
jgi:hypothetical protein